MGDFLEQPTFNYISRDDRTFVYAFDDAMHRLGYDFGGAIGSGYCWGPHMLIYRKTGVKSDRVYARIYLRESGSVLRLFFSDVDRHRQWIEAAPPHINTAFTGPAGDCQHCESKPDDCRFRKTYTIGDRSIEKCTGIVFEFPEPNLEKLPDYLAVFSEFYPSKVRDFKAN